MHFKKFDSVLLIFSYRFIWKAINMFSYKFILFLHLRQFKQTIGFNLTLPSVLSRDKYFQNSDILLSSTSTFVNGRWSMLGKKMISYWKDQSEPPYIYIYFVGRITYNYSVTKQYTRCWNWGALRWPNLARIGP
jgi:hypothetical protein